MTVTDRIARAKYWVDTLYQTDGTYGYLKEYPGFPVGILTAKEEWRLSGDWRSTLTGWMPVSQLTRLAVNPTNDITKVGMEDKFDMDYNEPVLTVWREYSPGGYTTYNIRFDKFQGDSTVDVWSGQYQLWVNILGNPPKYNPAYDLPVPPTYHVERGTVYFGRHKNGGGGGTTSPPDTRVIYRGNYAGMPCNRYTVRHAARLGQFLYEIWQDNAKAYSLSKLRSDFGFTYDIYDPLFANSTWEAEDFMFTRQAYADTSSVVARLPRGRFYYPYLSKVSLSRDTYIFESHIDPLLRMLQAIHLLNKYHDPNHAYNTLGDGFPKSTPLVLFNQQVTPVSIAQECIDWWNGVGISHPQDNSVASGVRTAVFLALTTLLGYRYGVSEMQQTALDVAHVLTETPYAPQGGYWPLDRGWIMTEVDGVYKALLRPPYDGAFYNLWTNTGSMSAACNKSSSFLSNLIDMFNMPIEEEGPIAANIESTITMLQALRIYNHYVLGQDYPPPPNWPSTQLLP